MTPRKLIMLAAALAVVVLPPAPAAIAEAVGAYGGATAGSNAIRIDLAAPGGASQSLSLPQGKSAIVDLPVDVRDVLVSNPGVADVTIQDPQTLVLTGKSYGETNLIVLDSAGNPVADTMVSVVQAPSDMVTVYAGTARNTLSCQPVCQQTVTLGDDQAFSAAAAGSAALLQSTAK